MTSPAASRRKPSPWGDFAVAAVLVLCGVAYGGWSTWLVPFRLWHGVEGLSLVITVVGNLAIGLLAAWGLQSVAAAVCPAAGWLAVNAVLTFVNPGGDVVVPGSGLTADPGVEKVGEFNWLAWLVSALLVLFLASRRWGYTRTAARPTKLG